ncbi:hypothetical protein SMC26_39800 [Actinomadura fulvescens]|uniref:Uncharacterized protein n=1 Tax=Actinomadura fulvescens TaxID=46160 RepID=A0ABP6DBR3_9ACTN
MGKYLEAGDTYGPEGGAGPLRRVRTLLVTTWWKLGWLRERWMDRHGTYFHGHRVPETRHWLRVWWQDDVRGH